MESKECRKKFWSDFLMEIPSSLKELRNYKRKLFFSTPQK